MTSRGLVRCGVGEHGDAADDRGKGGDDANSSRVRSVCGSVICVLPLDVAVRG